MATAGKYASEHRMAHAEVSAAGAPIAFTWTTRVVDDATDAESAPVQHSMTGVAMKVRGRARAYEILTLIEADSPTLLFVPDTYGDCPPLNAIGTWATKPMGIRSIDPLAPDGVTITARLIVSR